jgi:glycosyltransferase involved in cell wall biosynthesis
MRLGFIVEPRAPNSNYRAIFPMRALEKFGHEVRWPAQLERDLPLEELAQCDLVHCFRRPDRARDLKQLSERGVAVSFDNDDDFGVADMTAGASGDLEVGAKARLGNAKRFTEMLRLTRVADLTTTPSYVLAEKYRAAQANHVAVIENHLDGEVEGFGAKAAHAGVVVGWVAGREHERDLAQLPIVEALARLLELHSDVRVVTVGLRLPLRSERYEFRPKVPFGQLLPTIADFDVGIAPLADTPFNHARSDVKLKEYGAVGAAWLASPVGAYSDMGKAEGGRLVGDREWLEALDRVVRGGFKRRRLAGQALRWSKAQTIDRFASQWEQEFLLAIERAAARSEAPGGKLAGRRADKAPAQGSSQAPADSAA